MDGSLRLLLVDDHDYVLISLATGLEAYEGVSVVGMITDPSTVVPLCLKLQPTVVLTDLMMSGEDQGFTVIRDLRQSCPTIPVVMLTAYASDENRDRALHAGAAGFLDKSDLTLDHLIAALRRIVTGNL